MYGGPQQSSFVQAVQSLTGITQSPDLNGGSPNCVSFTPNVSLSTSFYYWIISNIV
jgi:choline dehydrogenase